MNSVSSMDGDERLTRARSAQALWAALSVPQRAKALRSLRHAIARHIDQLVDVISAEADKPPMDSLAGDVMVTLEQLSYYERTAAKTLRRSRRGKPAFFYRGASFVETYEPFGAVIVFAPWNYPLQLALIPAATALFAGNAVILKCSDRTPRTAALIAAIYKETSLPDDLLRISCEPAQQAAALVDAKPDLIFFTGSSHNGRAIAEKAAAHLVPVVMELGGKDAAIVFASCDLERTVNGLTYGSFSNNGQVCVGTKRIYVEQTIYDEFLRKFCERVSQLRIGYSQDSDLTPLPFSNFHRNLVSQIDDAIGQGAKLATAWNREADAIPPLILTNVPTDAALLAEETFAPVVCIAPFSDAAEAIALANASAFALGASVWTGDREHGASIAAQLHCGVCAINDVIRNIGNPETAFGGNGASGYGRYRGAEGLKTFSRIKSVMTAGSLERNEIHWFPFTAKTFIRLRALLLARHSDTLIQRIKALMVAR